jgi:hypothetical protein
VSDMHLQLRVHMPAKHPLVCSAAGSDCCQLMRRDLRLQRCTLCVRGTGASQLLHLVCTRCQATNAAIDLANLQVLARSGRITGDAMSTSHLRTAREHECGPSQPAQLGPRQHATVSTGQHIVACVICKEAAFTVDGLTHARHIYVKYQRLGASHLLSYRKPMAGRLQGEDAPAGTAEAIAHHHLIIGIVQRIHRFSLSDAGV